MGAVLWSWAPAAVAAGACVVLEDFSRGQVGHFPPDWSPRREAGRPVYAIQEEAGRRFLRAHARHIGIQAARPAEWDPAAYPWLAWAWRVQAFPTGADERRGRTNDSAVAVYAVFPHSPLAVRALKYVWSAALPAGTRFDSSGGLTQGRVLRSGPEAGGQWVEERVNVLEDYRQAFGADPPRPRGIAVLTDADDTRSEARGDYAAFRACRP